MMKGASEGVRRLALLLGMIGSTAWLIFAAFVTQFFTQCDGSGWAVFFVGMGICFLFPFLVVQGTAWVIRGFREDNKNGPTQQTTVTEKEKGRNQIQMKVAPSQNLQEETPPTMRN